MDFVSQFGPHLPFLRRYARALTGRQESGDAYIRASLTALADRPPQIAAETDTRVSLYRLFHAIWGNTGAALETTGTSTAPEGRLQALAPINRQAFLLTTLEGFTQDEAATILDVTAADIDRLVDEAQQEIERGLRTRVLIVEDEAVIAADLEHFVLDLGHQVTANATTRDEAIAFARNDPPGLVLCDVQLADDSSGLDAAHDILEAFDVPIIFITAFPERLLTGDRPEPTYLISKPYQEATVKAAIAQALFFHKGANGERA